MSKRNQAETKDLGDGLPPPITRQSQREDMWEEIKALRREIDSISAELTSSREQLAAKTDEVEKIRGHLKEADIRLGMVHAALRHYYP